MPAPQVPQGVEHKAASHRRGQGGALQTKGFSGADSCVPQGGWVLQHGREKASDEPLAVFVMQCVWEERALTSCSPCLGRSELLKWGLFSLLSSVHLQGKYWPHRQQCVHQAPINHEAAANASCPVVNDSWNRGSLNRWSRKSLAQHSVGVGDPLRPLPALGHPGKQRTETGVASRMVTVKTVTGNEDDNLNTVMIRKPGTSSY